MSGKDSEDETSSSSSEEEPFVDESSDKNFFKTLSCLKKKDPIIYDPDFVFFPENEDSNAPNKTSVSSKKTVDRPIFLRDYEREQVIKAIKKENSQASSNDDDDDGTSAVNTKSEFDEDLPYAVQQKSLKESLRAALEESDSDGDDGLLKLKKKSSEEQQKEEEEYKAWLKGAKPEIEDKETEEALKPLHDYWNKPDLDPNEQFLRDYILNRRYLEEDEAVVDDGISEDGELLEMQEQFENDYNLRFENENNTEVKRFPRVIEGSLRRKNESRKAKRKEKRERKLLEKGKKKEEISKNQKQKLLEFKEHIAKLKKLTGNEQLGFKDEEIFGDDDFDPEKHDAMMQKLYSDAFYAAEDDEEKPDFVAEEDVEGWVDDENFEDPGPDNMDLEVVPSTSKKSRKETRSKRKRKEKKKANTAEDILDVAKPVFDPNVHGSVQKYIDEYYSMDCEDFIEDIPCRFKYKQVIPNDYGLTVEEILAADDKELNKWVPAKKITKLKPDHVEKNEVKVYRQKAHDFSLKKKILASVYGSPERDDAKEEDESNSAQVAASIAAVDQRQESKNNKKGKKNKRKREAAESSTDAGATDGLTTEQNGNAGASAPEKKRKKTGSAQQQNLSDHKSKNAQTVSKPSAHVNPKAFDVGSKNKKKFGKGPRKDWAGDRVRKDVDPITAVSDLRLKAYDIKPREFKKKLKYKK